MRTLQELIALANDLYDDRVSVEKWLEVFKPLELAKLWYETCRYNEKNPFGSNYDDEVYESLAVLGYFQ